MATKNSWKLTTQPTKKSTLTGTDTTRGGGPDEGNVGHNKEMISKHQQRRKNKPEWIKRKQPERIMTPYRTKKAVGGVIKAGKRFLDFIKTGKRVDKDGVKVNVPKAAERLTGKPHVDHGKRVKKGHGGSAAQQHYLQHGYGPVKTKLRSGKPKIAIKGW